MPQTLTKSRHTNVMNCVLQTANPAKVRYSYSIPSQEARNTYPSYRSTEFKVTIDQIICDNTNVDLINEYIVDNAEFIRNLEERASLLLELELYWDGK